MPDGKRRMNPILRTEFEAWANTAGMGEKYRESMFAAFVAGRSAASVPNAWPTEGQPVFLTEAAMSWWEGHRPTAYTVEQHIADPTVNCGNLESAELAKACAVIAKNVVSGSHRKSLEVIGGLLNVSGQRGLRHLETDLSHPRGAGIHIASGKSEAMLSAICDVVNVNFPTR